MYGMIATFAVMAAIVVLFGYLKPTFTVRIVHVVEHKGDIVEPTPDEQENAQNTLDEALHSVQEAINIVNGGGVKPDVG